LRPQVKVQKVLAFMLAKAKTDAAAAASIWITRVEALKEELAELQRK